MTDISSQAAASPHSSVTSGQETNASLTCGICFEPPSKFGLMVNCSHVFCLRILSLDRLEANMFLVCIRKWRDREGKTEETVIEGYVNLGITC